MTTHRRNEAISFVSWIDTENLAGPVHIRRPRSQKGISYCDERIPNPGPVKSVTTTGAYEARTAADGLRIVELTVADPDHIPLEISIERDFARLCSKCARTFFNEVAEENSELRWSGVLVSVPILWQVIHTRSGLSPAEREARDAIPSPHEHEITREELAEESAEEEKAYAEEEPREWGFANPGRDT